MNIAIIGAGAGGLAAAYELAKAGHTVTVYEAGPEVGGLAAGFRDERWEWTLEKFYHHWFQSDRDILSLLDEIGCGEKVRFVAPVTSYWTEQGTFALDKPVVPIGLLARVINILNIPRMSLIDKLRLGIVGAYVSFIPDGVFLEKYTADAWLERWMGKAAHERIWKPLLIGKFGPLYAQVNMAWFWARIRARSFKLGTYVGGFQTALTDIAAAAQKAGASLLLNTPVEAIAPAGDGLEVKAGKAGGRFDAVLATTSPSLFMKIAPELPADYAEKVRGLRSMGALSMILALDRPLMTDGTYWLNLPARSDEKDGNPFPFLALVEHTNYQSSEHYGGDHIVYLGDYLPPDHEYFKLSEDELAALFLPSLKKINPDFSTEWIRKRWVYKAPYAQPVPFTGHSQHIPDIRTPVKGLYLASMSQVYPWDRGTNYAVEIVRRAIRMIMVDREV